MKESKTYKSYTNSENTSRQLIPLLTAISLFLGIFIGVVLTVFGNFLGTALFSSNSDNGSNESFVGFESQLSEDLVNNEKLEEFFEEFSARYLKEYDGSNEAVTDAFINGFVSSLDDRYTAYFTPEEATQYLQSSAGEFEGVGIVLSFDNEFTYVETVLEGFPAQAAGIRNGDLILKVDEIEVEGRIPAEVAQLIRGPKGSEVTLTVFREGEEISIDIVRDTIEIAPIAWERLDDNTALIEISQFTDENVSQFNALWDSTVDEITNEMPNLDSVVVDLRNNPGGFVLSVIHVTEEFLSDGEIIFQERSKAGIEEIYYDRRNGAFEDIKVSVIVNEGSASASEIFSAAIQENEKGSVVGKQTVGKGVEQERVTLSDGSILLVVFQEWLTPSGRVISEEEPITPDFDVDFTDEDFENDVDPQLDRALELVN